MNPPYPDLNAIVISALAYPAGAERSGYLDQACPRNLTFRRQVEAIVRAHDEARSGFAAVQRPAPPPDPSGPSRAGSSDGETPEPATCGQREVLSLA